MLAARVQLGQRRLDRAPAGRAGDDVGGGLTLEQDGLAREIAHTLKLILLDRPGRAAGDFE
jgi:hypothetical protein